MRRALGLASIALVTLVASVLGIVVAYRWLDPPITPLMIIRTVEGEGAQRRPVPLRAVAPSLARAVLAAEDNRFCLHHGVDWIAVEDAIEDWERRDRLRGASTITMQVARNLFLWPGGGLVRKAVEVPLAFAIDALWPKRRVLEVYLQIAEWGRGVFGAEAAARAHFRKSALQLTGHESALLAAILPDPRGRDPARPTPALARRAEAITARGERLGGLLGCLR